jgi:predicted MFS family arabinose efflux permease
MLLALLVATQFTAFVDRNLSAALAPQLKTSFGLTDAQFGALQGPFFIVLYTLATFAAGFVTQHKARLRLIAGCVFVWTAGSVLFALGRDFAQLAAGRLLLGLGQALFAPCALAVIADGVAGAARGRTLSTFTAGSSVGRSAAFLLAGLALAWVGSVGIGGLQPWRAVTLAMAAPNVLLFAAFLIVREPPSVQPRGASSYGTALAWLRAQPAVVCCVIGGAAASVTIVQSLTAWGASVLHRQFGVPVAAAALGFGAALIPAALIGHLGGGLLVDRLRRTRWTPLDLIVVGLAVAASSATIGVWAPNPILAGAALALATLGASAAGLAGLAAMQAMSPASDRGPLGAVFLGMTSLIGFGVGPITTGLISDHRGAGSTALSGSLAILVGAAAVLGAGAAIAGRNLWRAAERAASADETPAHA